MLTVTIPDAGKLSRDLELFAKKAVPFATRDALNGSAFAAQRHWRGEIEKAFTLRNQFTTRSVQVEKARGMTVSRMQATVGSVAEYMGTQESGGTVQAKSKRKPIPGPVAAGQAPAGKRTKLVRPGFRLSSIQVAALPSGSYGKRRRNAIAIAVAIRKGQRFAILNRMTKGAGRGLFEVKGNKRSARTRLLWDVSKKAVKVPPSHTLEKALRSVEPELIGIHEKAVLKQLRMHKVLGY